MPKIIIAVDIDAFWSKPQTPRNLSLILEVQLKQFNGHAFSHAEIEVIELVNLYSKIVSLVSEIQDVFILILSNNPDRCLLEAIPKAHRRRTAIVHTGAEPEFDADPIEMGYPQGLSYTTDQKLALQVIFYIRGFDEAHVVLDRDVPNGRRR